MNLAARITGWKHCDWSDYQRAYDQFGGSLFASPQILSFIHQRFAVRENFWATYDASG